jgi:hypothetical protein
MSDHVLRDSLRWRSRVLAQLREQRLTSLPPRLEADATAEGLLGSSGLAAPCSLYVTVTFL